VSLDVVSVVQSIHLLPLLNLALRASTLLAKFLLVFILARFLPPAEVGLYGLLAATVTYALYAVGLDFHAFTMREILKGTFDNVGVFLKSHAALCGLLYAALLPVGFCIFVGGLLPWSLAPWFFCLLVLEHLNQEMSRLMIAIGSPMWGSVLLFFRSGLWPVAVAVLMFADPQYRTLLFVFQAWALGALTGLLVGGWKLSKARLGGWSMRVDWQWIYRGVKVAVPLICATLALRGLSTFDRYWYQGLADAESLGAYVLFAGISASLLSFLDAGVFAFIYPALIKAYQAGDSAAYTAGLRRLGVQTLALSLGFACCALIIVHPLLLWLGKPIYLAHLSLFFWLLGASVLSALAMVPHYALYAQGRDRPIIQSHLLGLFVFFIVTALLASVVDGFAVPVGLCAAFAFILCWKALSFYRLTPARFRSQRPDERQSVT
jgi:O-antigen/teichoic acid export membrane protein